MPVFERKAGLPGYCAAPGRVRNRRGFTLLELLVSTAIFALMLVMIFSIINQTGMVWRSATKNLSTFQSARQAFDILTHAIGAATLNTHWDYQFTGGQPDRYRRNSDLHFLLGAAGQNGLPGTEGCGQAVFFQALLGKNTTAAGAPGANQFLNELGFYVEFGSDHEELPSLLRSRLSEKYRYRLFQTIKPTEELTIYTQTNSSDWIDPANAQPIADNVIALILAPRRAPAEEETRGLLTLVPQYDSRKNDTAAPQPVTAHQLPPFLEVFLVAIDETSALRIQSGGSPPPKIAQALSGKFLEVAQLSQDLEDLEKELLSDNIQSRVFSTRIPMRESKWSEY